MAASVHNVAVASTDVPYLPARTGLHAAPNCLLSAISPQALNLVLQGAVKVTMRQGHRLTEIGDPIVHCWFPLSGLVGMIAATSVRTQAVIGLVGSEGFIDCATILRGDRSITRAAVIIPGEALRVDAAQVAAAIDAAPDFAPVMMAYAQAFLIQVADTALANGHFTIEPRLARLLLMCADRVGLGRIPLTHGAVAAMLGVRRAGVTVALSQLRQTGAINYERAGIDIVDRRVLEGIAHDCYGRPETEYRRLVGRQPGPPSMSAVYTAPPDLLEPKCS